ncbi:nuclear transport factor 2 family protein [Scytonema tolypothrichoides VB-61278]|nr:nuclear transport factor 2 family protein [Scytonema tolypothrichoides VB-61278]
MLMRQALISATLILSLFTITPTKATETSVTTMASAQTNAEAIRQKNEQTIRTYFELLSQKRMDEWLKLWADDGVQDMPYSPAGFPKRVEGKAAVAKHYSALPTSVGRMVFPDLRIYPTTDPNTFFVEFRGEIEVLATKKPYNNTYAGLFKFRDGKVVLFREYYDPIVFQEAWGNPSGFTQQR